MGRNVRQRVTTHKVITMAVSTIIQIDTPYITIDEFIRRASTGKEDPQTGKEDLTWRAVQEMCLKGKLPIKERENARGRIFINNALLTLQAVERRY